MDRDVTLSSTENSSTLLVFAAGSDTDRQLQRPEIFWSPDVKPSGPYW